MLCFLSVFFRFYSTALHQKVQNPYRDECWELICRNSLLSVVKSKSAIYLDCGTSQGSLRVSADRDLLNDEYFVPVVPFPVALRVIEAHRDPYVLEDLHLE